MKFSKNLLIPKKGIVYEHRYVYTTYGSWTTWSSLIAKTELTAKTKVSTVPHILIDFYLS